MGRPSAPGFVSDLADKPSVTRNELEEAQDWVVSNPVLVPPSKEEEIKARLKEVGITQKELAAELQVSESRLSRVLSGKAPLNDAERSQISKKLSVSLDDISPPLVYISAPLTALQPTAAERHRNVVEAAIKVLASCDVTSYWPGLEVTEPTRGRPPDLSSEKNLPNIVECRSLLYLQFEPPEMPTGSHVEVGMALGQGKPVFALYKRTLDVPFIFHGLHGSRLEFLPPFRLYPLEDATEVPDMLRNLADELVRTRI